MPNLQCINCNVRVARLRRHSLSTESEAVINLIRLWTYPRDITPLDSICHACWELASHQPSSDVPRQFGHLHVCVVCGRSTLRTNSRRVIFEGANDEEQRMVNVISSWIQPRELSPEHETCVLCWQRARRTACQSLSLVSDTDTPDTPQLVSDNETAETPQMAIDDEPAAIPQMAINIEPAGHLSPLVSDDNILMCNICGNSLTTLTRPSSSPEGQILERIYEMIENQRMPSRSDVCIVCWQQIQQLLSHTQFVTLPNMRRAANTRRHCVFQCSNVERHRVPDSTRKHVLINYQYYLPRGARICTVHLNEAPYDELYTAAHSLDTFSPEYMEDIIFLLTEGLTDINYENIETYPDNQVEFLFGYTKAQHRAILERTPRLRNMRRGSFALTALLCKLRTGESGDRLSILFKVPRRTLETLMGIAREIMLNDFVPQYLGFSHLTRERVMENNSYIAEGLFGEPDAPPEEKPAITIADATYIYTQKSSNYLFQKDTYSLHKNRNLVKPFVMCCCNGYIIDVWGPYSAITNDATIMQTLLNQNDFNHFYKENDIFILDRGFRDCMDSIHEKGYLAYMPETREDGHSQLTTLEGNRSRCVTITRWVVEAVNGRFKRDFKLLRQEYFNRACKNLMTDLKIAAALLNAFCRPFIENINSEEFVNIINDRLFITNSIAHIVSERNLNRRGPLFFNPIDSSRVAFPRLSMQDLVLFACGIYQIRQARSYLGEHFRYHGIYTLDVGTDQIHGLEGINPMLLRAKISSRHSPRSKTYFVYIVVERNVNGREAILSYCCNCIVGLRTVGCCSHVMSIVWYLGYARHEGMRRPADNLDSVILRRNE